MTSKCTFVANIVQYSEHAVHQCLSIWMAFCAKSTCQLRRKIMQAQEKGKNPCMRNIHGPSTVDWEKKGWDEHPKYAPKIVTELGLFILPLLWHSRVLPNFSTHVSDHPTTTLIASCSPMHHMQGMGIQAMICAVMSFTGGTILWLDKTEYVGEPVVERKKSRASAVSHQCAWPTVLSTKVFFR